MQRRWQNIIYISACVFPLTVNLSYQGERGASGIDGRPGLDGKPGASGPPGQRVPQFQPAFYQTIKHIARRALWGVNVCLAETLFVSLYITG